MNLVAMNIDTFEERLLHIEAAFNNRLWGVSRVFLRVALSSSEYFAPFEESIFGIPV